MNQKPINIGIIGLGTVGCGVLNVLQRNQDEIKARAGRPLNVVIAAVNDLKKTRDCDMSTITLTDNINDVVSHPDVDVVLELMGGEDEACAAVLAALENDKHVITANKAMIAKHGNDIFARANKRGLMVQFEAAVAGGIPIIKAIREGLAANRISKVVGILNGTSNYILSEMYAHGHEFADCLQDAQQRGFAEADPSMDIDGIDVAHKLTILASLAFGIPLQFNQVLIEGIRNISALDIQYAHDLGYIIKHLGVAKYSEQGIECRVHPALIPAHHTLAHVNGAMNAVLVQADALGESLYYGAGAGAEPTASAVIADLVDVAREMGQSVPYLAFQPESIRDIPIVAPENIDCAYYLRLQVNDKPGVLADITRIFAEQSMSIESILQKHSDASEGKIPVVIVTHRVSETTMQNTVQQLQQLADVSVAPVCIRLTLHEE